MKITVNEKGAEALKLLIDTYLKVNGLNGKNNVDLIIQAIEVADPTLLEGDKEVENAMDKEDNNQDDIKDTEENIEDNEEKI